MLRDISGAAVIGCRAVQDCRWTVSAASDLLWRSWDEEQTVVYHVASGDTHLLNQVAAQTLRSLQEHPSNISELSERVAAALDAVVDEAFTKELERLLAEFDELGLIERSS